MSIFTSAFYGLLEAVHDLLTGPFGESGAWAAAVVLLTLLIRVVLLPTDLKQLRLGAAMGRIAPQVKAIDETYDFSDERKQTDPDGWAADRRERNAKVTGLYRADGVNPLSVAVPLLVQTPFFIVLFATLRDERFTDLRAGTLGPLLPDQAGLGFIALDTWPNVWPLIALMVAVVAAGVARAIRAKGRMAWGPVVFGTLALLGLRVIPVGALLAANVSGVVALTVRTVYRRHLATQAPVPSDASAPASR